MASPHPSPTLVETKHEAPDAKSRVSTETSFNNPAQDLTPPTSVGVKRMEAVARAGEKRPVLMWTIRICVLITAWVYTLQ